MIIKRRLFSKRRNLTPEEEYDRDKRDHYLRTAYAKSNYSHYVTKKKSSPFITGGGNATNNLLESPRGAMPKEVEIDQISQNSDKDLKATKKALKAVRKNKKGIIVLNKDAKSDTYLHELGHGLAVDENEGTEDGKIAYEGYNYRSQSTSNLPEALENKRRVEEGSKRALRKEEMSNEKGEEIIKRYGGKYNTPEDIAQYRKAREKGMEINRAAVKEELNKADKEIEKHKS